MTHDLDVCDCGDYRRDHKDGHGACAFNETGMNGGPTHGFRKCLRFKLHREHSEPTVNIDDHTSITKDKSAD